MAEDEVILPDATDLAQILTNKDVKIETSLPRRTPPSRKRGCKVTSGEEYAELQALRENAKRVKINEARPSTNFRFGSLDLNLEGEEGEGTLYFRDKAGRQSRFRIPLKIDQSDLEALRDKKPCVLSNVLHALDNEQYHVRDGLSECQFVRADVGQTPLENSLLDQLECNTYVKQLRKYLYENTPHSVRCLADMGGWCPDEDRLASNGRVYLLPGGKLKPIYKARIKEEEEQKEVIKQEEEVEEEEEDVKSINEEDVQALKQWGSNIWNRPEREVIEEAKKIWSLIPTNNLEAKQNFLVLIDKYSKYKRSRVITL